VGVSIRRFDTIPDPHAMANAALFEHWITAFRDDEGLYLVRPSDDGNESIAEPIHAFSSPEENESAQFAVELALASWPDWGAHFRATLQPRTIIPLPKELPEA
jgi:hypothetical protein